MVEMPLKAPHRAPWSLQRRLPWTPSQAAPDRPARSAYGNFGKPSGEPRMLQGRNGCTQRLKVVFLHFYLGIFQG
jgi:hypothetical protein